MRKVKVHSSTLHLLTKLLHLLHLQVEFVLLEVLMDDLLAHSLSSRHTLRFRT